MCIRDRPSVVSGRAVTGRAPWNSIATLEALFCGFGLFSILDTLRAGTRKRILQIVCLAMVVLAFVIEPERMLSLIHI